MGKLFNKTKIGIILPWCSVGGAKYLYLLVQGIVNLRPDYEIVIWEDFNDDYVENLIKTKLIPLGVKFIKFNSKEFVEKKKSKIRFLNNLINGVRKIKKSFNKLAPRMLNKYDLIFCPSPYDFPCPQTTTPIICVPHDLNYAHHFGGRLYGLERAKKIKQQHEEWFQKSMPIVSTNFMADEIRKIFPVINNEIGVVHLSKFNDCAKLEESLAAKIVEDLGIDGDFIMSANNSCYHKNYNVLYNGFYHLKQKYPKLKLIITGDATQEFKGKSNSPNYIDIFSENPDVIGLGLVSDETLIALMQKSKVVINASLYEAGSGSSLDAWSLGVPVALSDIEPFKEQMNVLGTKGQIFNPQSGKELSEAVINILENAEQVKLDVESSKEAINKYTWEHVAQKYIQIFEKVMQ